MTRNEIDKKYKWDMTAVFASDADFLTEAKSVENEINGFDRFADEMIGSAEGLLSAVSALTAIHRRLEKLADYASRSFDVDKTDNAKQALDGRVEDLYNRLGEHSSFFGGKILEIGREKFEKWAKELPGLEAYRRTIEERLRYAPHTLGESEEKLLSTLSASRGGCANAYSILTDSDMKFGKIRGEDGRYTELTDSNYVTFLMSSDRRVRKAAFDKMYETLGSFKNTIATIMNGFVKEQVAWAKARNYPSAMEASVFRDDVPVDICNNLIDTVEENLGVLYRYYDLKRRMLGLSKLHMYDLYPSIIADCDKRYEYDEAVPMVLEALAPLGKDYTDALEKGYESGWVDVYPTPGKRGGAYSGGAYDTAPYMLLNYNGTFDDVSTLAHESGHSMHSYYSCKSNSFQNSGYTIFVAEVPSTVNELLLANDRLAKATDKKEKLFILNQLLEVFKGTLFRQTMFAKFEKVLYSLCESGETLTADLLCEKYYEIVKKYFGKDVVVDKAIACEWMRIPHFYYNFYVYKYATCISAAAAVVKHIEREGDAYVDKYKAFLSCGSSKSPLDSLMVAGIDLRSPEVVKDAISLFSDLLDRFEAVLAE